MFNIFLSVVRNIPYTFCSYFSIAEWLERAALDYSAIRGLSAEAREKLKMVRPLTVGQAARIPGVRQGDIALLMILHK